MKRIVYPCEFSPEDKILLSQLKEYASRFGLNPSNSELIRLCVRLAGRRLLAGDDLFIPAPLRNESLL